MPQTQQHGISEVTTRCGSGFFFPVMLPIMSLLLSANLVLSRYRLDLILQSENLLARAAGDEVN